MEEHRRKLDGDLRKFFKGKLTASDGATTDNSSAVKEKNSAAKRKRSSAKKRRSPVKGKHSPASIRNSMGGSSVKKRKRGDTSGPTAWGSESAYEGAFDDDAADLDDTVDDDYIPDTTDGFTIKAKVNQATVITREARRRVLFDAGSEGRPSVENKKREEGSTILEEKSAPQQTTRQSQRDHRSGVLIRYGKS